MERSANGSHRGRGASRGRGSFQSRGGRGGSSPFRGGTRGRGSFSGGERGRASFRGGERGRGSFGSGERGRASFRSGERGRGSFSGGERGRGSFRGGERGRGMSRRGERGGDRGRGMSRRGERGGERGRGSFRATPKPQSTENSDSNREYISTLLITNLPTDMDQFKPRFSKFLAKLTNNSVQKVTYKLLSDRPSSLSALCVVDPDKDCRESLVKLHGQEFHGHHLLVGRYHDFVIRDVSEFCIKVTNLSAAVTEEKLWELFVSCGKLGMIYLEGTNSDDTLEALVNFEEQKSLTNALKLDGTKLFKNEIKVTHLDHNLSVNIKASDGLESMLKDFNVTHIISTLKSRMATVFFSDNASYSKALKLSGKEWNVKPTWYLTYIADPDMSLTPNDICAVLGTKYYQIRRHPRKSGIHVVCFSSENEADAAIQASPVKINDQSFDLWNSVSKIPSSLIEKCEGIILKEEGNGSESELEGEEEEDEDEDGEEEEDEDDEDVNGEDESVDDEEIDGEDVEVKEEDEEGEDEEGDEDVEDEDEEDEDGEEEDEEEDEEDVEDEEEESDGSMDVGVVVPRPANGIKITQKQPSPHTDRKRKMNDKRILLGKNKMQKRN